MLFSVAFLGLRGGLKTSQVRPKTPSGSLRTSKGLENRGQDGPQNHVFGGLDIVSYFSLIFVGKYVFLTSLDV